MKQIFVLILIAVFVCGCEKQDRNINLKDSFRSILEVGDTLIYISNLNNEAVFVVLQKVEGSFFLDRDPYPWSNTVEGPGMAKNYYQAEATLIDSVGKVLTASQIKIIQEQQLAGILPMYSTTFDFPGFISIKNFAYGSTFYGTGKLSLSWYDFQQKDFITRSSMKILDQEFKNVFFCVLEPQAGPTGRYVSTVYCNSQKCLLGFEYSDGEIFELK